MAQGLLIGFSRAHDDADVVHTFKFNSHRNESDESGTEVHKTTKDPGVALIEDSLHGMERRHKANTEVQLLQVELAEAHERREIEAEA